MINSNTVGTKKECIIGLVWKFLIAAQDLRSPRLVLCDLTIFEWDKISAN